MTDAPRGFSSKDEYFADLARRIRSRKGSFYLSAGSHGQTRQGRGTTPGRTASNRAEVIGESSLYDEAYGPPDKVIRGGYTGGGSLDEGFIARQNKRDDIEEAERKAQEQTPQKSSKKKSK